MELKEILIYIILPVIVGLTVEALKGFPLSVKASAIFHKKKREQPKQEDVPEFTQYTKDFFDGFTYKWRWIRVQNGWQINKVHVCCPIDETPLIVESMFYIKCPRCKKIFSGNIPDIESAKIVIQDNVSRKYGAISV